MIEAEAMEAAVLNASRNLTLQDLPVPKPKAGEVLVRVEACGVCGSDKQVLAGEAAPPGTQLPVVLGHEIAGRIVQFGPSPENVPPGTGGAGNNGDSQDTHDTHRIRDGARSWSLGDEVLVYPFLPCGHCRLCTLGFENLCLSQEVIGYHRNGGYAHFVTVPLSSLVRKPHHLPAAVAAPLVDAFATSFHALWQVSKASQRDRVLILGTGGLGLSAVAVARAIPVQDVAAWTMRQDEESFEHARQTALAAGASFLWQGTPENARAVSREVRRWSEGGVDVVLDTHGTQASMNIGLQLLRPGGRLCVIGMDNSEVTLPSTPAWVRKGIQVLGSYGSKREDVETLVSWVESGRLNAAALPVIELPLSQIHTALAGKVPGRAVIRL